MRDSACPDLWPYQFGKVRERIAPVSVTDMHCDVCGTVVADPAGAVRFVYHPGNADLRDDSGLMCGPCWEGVAGWLGDRTFRECAVCAQRVTRTASLHLRRGDDPEAWQLCSVHAVEFLNRLRTVEPKLDPATFRFPYAEFN